MKKSLLLTAVSSIISFYSFGQVVHDDPNSRVQLGSKLFLQYRSEAANNWMRGFVGSSIKWNDATNEWNVGVNNQSDFSMMHFSNGGNITFYTRSGTGSNYSLSDGSLYAYARVLISSTGNMGIGTRNPQERLHVVSASSNDITWPIIANNPYNNSTSNPYGVGIKLKHSSSNEGWKWSGIASVNESGWANDSGLALFSDGSEKVRIKANGSVGIGTTSTGPHKLAVEGSVGAREIKVQAPGTGWSDFVFEEDYNLRSLKEVENFISENNHLPDIPSETEVTESGINLGEMDAKLLQKIEELTLYLIEQNKKIEALAQENKELRTEVINLKRN